MNSGTDINGNSGTLALAGITNITVNAGGGVNTISVGTFAGTLPGLTIQGVAGSNSVTLGGALTFVANHSLSVAADDITVSAAVTVSGSGSIEQASKGNLMLAATAALTTAAGGNVSLTADSDADGIGIVTTTTGSTVNTSGGAVTVVAADVALGGDITAGGGTVVFRASQTDAPISLGSVPLVPAGTQLWKSLCGSTTADSIKAMRVDSDGNVYLLGMLNAGSPRQFSGNTIAGRGGNDVFVAKLDPDGTQQYFRRAGSSGNDTPVALAVDDSGNAVVAGMLSSSSNPRDFDGTLLSAQGGNDIFVAKINSIGSQVYFKLTGSTGADSVTALALDSSGNVYVTGHIVGSAGNTPKDFTGSIVTGVGDVDVFVAKLDASGVQQYFKMAGSTQADTVTTLSVDGSGIVHLIGTIYGTAANTPTGFDGVTLAGIGLQDAFVAKLDASGNQVFCKLAGSLQNDVASVMAVDASGNVILGGSLTVDPAYTPKDFNGTAITGYTGPGGGAMFVAKLDGSGTQQFFKVGGNTQQFVVSSVPTALALDASGQIYLTGTLNGDASTVPKDFNGATLSGLGSYDVFVAKLNASGVQVYFTLAGSSQNDTVTAMTLDGSGNVTLTGTLNGETANTPKDFNGNTLAGFGSDDIYVAQLNASGSQLFFQMAGSTVNDAPASLALDASGNILLTGTLNGDVANSPKDFGGTLLTGFGNADLFVAKLNASGGQRFFKMAGSTGTDAATAVAADATGDLLFAGTIVGNSSPTDFAGSSFGGYAAADVLVVKLKGESGGGGFDVSDAELDRVTANTVDIGEAGNGVIAVRETISPTTYQFLALENDTTFTSTGGFRAVLAGTTAGTDFSQVQVTGTATLDGMLFAELANGFYPAPSDAFTVLLADTVDGTFAVFEYPYDDVGMEVGYGSGDVTINVINVHPVIDPIADQTIDEQVPFSLAVMATDADAPAQTLTYQLDGAPAGASISSGVISWTPTEDQGPLTTSITVLVTDDGNPNLTASRTFQITVNEVNYPPVVTNLAAATDINKSLTISTNKLLHNFSDIDGDPLTVTAASATSTNGGTVVFTGTNLTYTPVNNFFGADRVDFTVFDGVNNATGHILVTVRAGNVQGVNIVGIVDNGNGTVTVTFAGIPNRYYLTQSTTNLSAPVPPYWVTLSTNQASTNGIWSYTDPVLPGARYYRSTGGTTVSP